MVWAKKIARLEEKHLSLEFGVLYIRAFTLMYSLRQAPVDVILP